MSRRFVSSFLLALFAPISVAPPLVAGVVTVGPMGAHAAIQPAVDAALGGDTILVAPGTYTGFTVNGKPLQIVASSTNVAVTNAVVIQNVAAGGNVSLSGFDLTVLQLGSCAGSIRIHASSIAQVYGVNTSPPTVSVNLCPDVAFTRCVINGYLGLGALANGGVALRVTASSVALYDCTVHGGPGASGTSIYPGMPGGAGLLATGSVFASNTTFTGGDGGNGGCHNCAGTPCPTGGGQGASGIQVMSGTVRLLDVTATGGVSGTPGCGNPGGGQSAAAITGTVTQLTGLHRELDGPFVAREGQTPVLVFRGQPGDVVLLGAAEASRFVFSDVWNGVSLVRLARPPLLEQVGTIPPSGTLTKAWLVPDLGTGVQSRALFLQAWHVEPGGTATLGSPATIELLDAAY